MATHTVARRIGRRVIPPAGRRRARDMIERFPAAYCAVLRRRHPHWPVARPGMDLLIEGFPSSGNTFAVKAMVHANPGINIASHVHRGAHVVRALQLDIPAMIMLRSPLDAITSAALRGGTARVQGPAEAYVRFHRGIERVRDGVLVAPFDVVISRFGDVVAALNDRFATSFQTFDHDDAEAVQAVMTMIDAEVAERRAEDAQLSVARPTAHRAGKLPVVRERLLGDPSCRPWLEQAQESYDRLLATSPLR